MKRDGPEAQIQEAFIKMLRLRDWFVVVMHGNMHQFGFPDLFCCHHMFGIRLVEIKNPLNYRFTAAQYEKFPKLSAHGAGIWIITGATEEEYQKLFAKPNWYWFLK